MKRYLHELKTSAETTTRQRGHTITWDDHPERGYSRGQCDHCRHGVTVKDRPLPNSIDIGGSAIGSQCDPDARKNVSQIAVYAGDIPGQFDYRFRRQWSDDSWESVWDNEYTRDGKLLTQLMLSPRIKMSIMPGHCIVFTRTGV